ncbi:hypothetical protein KJZ61_01500 [Candidatus Dependentiae bacterium]|nr:hypothetical protein [Candidatus Dependentiae bacterium]
MKVFSIKQALLYGFKSSFRHLFFLVGMTAIVAVTTFLVASVVFGTISLVLISRLPEVCEFIQRGIVPSNQEISSCFTALLNLFSDHWFLYSMIFALGLLIIYLVLCYLSLGWFNALLHLYDHKKGSFRALVVHPRLLFPFTIASILYGIIVLLGSVALIVPGIIFALMFMMFGYVIVDKKAGIIESFRTSAHITRGVKWRLFWLLFIIMSTSLLLEPLDNVMLLRLWGLSSALIYSFSIIGALLRAYLFITVLMISVYTYRTLNAQTYAPVK